MWTGERGYNLMAVPYLGDFGELAENLKLYREACKNAGHGDQGGRIMVALHLYLAQDRQTAIDEARGPMENYISTFREPARWWLQRQSSNYQRYGQIVELIDGLNYDRIVSETRALVGDPDDVTNQLHYLYQMFGDVEFSLQVNFSMLTDAQATRSLELFARHAMPRFPNS